MNSENKENVAKDAVEKQDDSDNLEDSIRRFGGETSLHGLSHIVTKETHAIQRVAWLILLTGAIFTLSMYVYENIHFFYSRPVSTTVSIKQRDELEFPSITFCNYNQARQSVTTESEQLMLSFFFDLEEDDIDIFTGDYSEYNDTIVEDFLHKAAHTVEGAVDICKWESFEDCGPANFSTVVTDFGVCFTFNHKNNRRLTVQRAGKTGGLYLRLNVEQYEYTYGTSTAAGFKMLVHTRGERPLVSQFGFAVSPGFETLVAFRQTLYKSLKKPYASECVDNGLSYSNVYTQTLCQEECIADELNKECGCRHAYYPGNRSHRKCTVTEAVECVIPKSKNLAHAQTDCSCQTACQYTDYVTKVSSALWPADHIISHLEHVINRTAETIRKNYLDVYLYYEDISYEHVEQVPAYSSIKLLCDIGGLMGLLCGMSLMTIIEIVEFVGLSLGKCFRKRSQINDGMKQQG